MAQSPPDISAILKALAQRPGGTPSQQPPPQNSPPPTTAASGYQSGASPPPVTSLNLPVPTSSGSVDLSAIRPINSGSVSLQDAIAKVRNTGVEKGSRSDDRYGSREYGARRDRSRSPVRRENFRDDYNTYRDERREGRSRGGGRDRSFSPGQPNYASYSGGGVDRLGQGQGAAGPTDSDTISVESSAVGLIIGRGGDNMRRIESESGARVQFITGPDNSGAFRQCRVSGTPRQRVTAIQEIYRAASENPSSKAGASRQPPTPQSSRPVASSTAPANEQERNLQIMVPDKTVGLIIGRRGETIRDLQERSGCHVNITSEDKSVNGFRPVNLIGNVAATTQAQDMIYAIVESDTRESSGSQSQQPPRRDLYQPPPQPNPYDPYAQPFNPYAPTQGAPGVQQTKITDSTLVPSEAVGMIIGKGGETIKDMQNVSSCKINVSPGEGADIQRHIELIGTRQAIEHAKRLIMAKVDTVREKQGGGSRGPAPTQQPYSDPYAQQQPNPYGQPPQGLPPGPEPTAPPASDPYAPYGGYNNYLAMWAAASNYQGQGQGPPA